MRQDFIRLRRLLILAGVTTTAAAQTVGCSRALFSEITNGHRRPSPIHAARLAALESSLARKAAPVVADLAQAVDEVVRHA